MQFAEWARQKLFVKVVASCSQPTDFEGWRDFQKRLLFFKALAEVFLAYRMINLILNVRHK